MRKRFPLLAAAFALLLVLLAWAEAASVQSLPSEGAKNGSIFGGAGVRGTETEPYRSPVSPPADNKRDGHPTVDPRQGPGSSPIPGNSYGDTVQKQNDEAKRQREMQMRR
jgi:hypothetical protein